MAEPSARRIVDVTADNSITCDEDAIREIFLDPQIKDKQVCVISVTGTLPQGKSFFINMILRHLELKYKWKKPISENWLRCENVISGFPWRCGSTKDKRGILVWPEIFVVEGPSGEEVALVLLDTQLTCESKTAPEDCAAVFAISTLLSSIQIHSIREKVQSSDLEPFECLAGFGYLGLEEEAKFGPPFQNLCVLIRDWPDQHGEYGASGGKKVLNKFIQSKEMWSQKTPVFNLFQKLTFYLLPHPGEITPTTDPLYERTFNDIKPHFAGYVEAFFPNVLAPKDLNPKTINGQKIKVSDLFFLVQAYCKYFKQAKAPSLSEIYMATDKAQLENALIHSEEVYTELLNTIVAQKEPVNTAYLEEAHLKTKKQALELFDKKKVLTIATENKHLRKLLEQKLEHRFLEYRRNNQLKLAKEKKKKPVKENGPQK